MTYSKWDSSANVYLYYETPEPNGVKKARMNKSSQLGVAADNAGHDLPKNAVFKGYGTQAKGILVKVHDTSNSLISLLQGLFK